MKISKKLQFSLLCMALLAPLYASAVEVTVDIKGGKWRCYSEDRSGHRWNYTRVGRANAIDDAFRACQRHSSRPGTCSVSPNQCHYEGAVAVIRPAPVYHDSDWKCMAYDRGPDSRHWYRSARLKTDARNDALRACERSSRYPNSCRSDTRDCHRHN